VDAVIPDQTRNRVNFRQRDVKIVNVPNGAKASLHYRSNSMSAAASIDVMSVTALVASNLFVDEHYIAACASNAPSSHKSVVSRKAPLKISFELRRRAVGLL
jgi:hypothetical protein